MTAREEQCKNFPDTCENETVCRQITGILLPGIQLVQPLYDIGKRFCRCSREVFRELHFTGVDFCQHITDGRAALPKKWSKWSLYASMVVAALGRALSATLAGIFFWDTAPWASLVYNGTYLVPETVICILLAIPVAPRVMKIMKK